MAKKRRRRLEKKRGKRRHIGEGKKENKDIRKRKKVCQAHT